jgi:hypothetical protein
MHGTVECIQFKAEWATPGLQSLGRFPFIIVNCQVIDVEPGYCFAQRQCWISRYR